MKLLIDIGHPAHVHLFKHLAFKLIHDGDTVHFTCREKEFEIDLLRHYGFEFTSFGRKYTSSIGKLIGLCRFNFKLLRVALKFKPDLLISHGSIYAAHVAWLIGKPHIALEDSGNMEQIRLYRPFTKVILTPDVLAEQLGAKQIRYPGYHELAYLWPKLFSPNVDTLKMLGVNEGEPYALFRFVSWKATHDTGQSGLTISQKRDLIYLLSKRMRVFISSEERLPPEFSAYQIHIQPEMMHDVLYYATLFIGEGATMASEAGVLGTPSIYVNSLVRQYNEDQEKYGLVFNFRSGEGVVAKINDLLNNNNLKNEMGKRRIEMLEDKINVNEFLIWFIRMFPDSIDLSKSNNFDWNQFRKYE